MTNLDQEKITVGEEYSEKKPLILIKSGRIKKENPENKTVINTITETKHNDRFKILFKSIAFISASVIVLVLGGYLKELPTNLRTVIKTIIPIVLGVIIIFYKNKDNYKKFVALTEALFILSVGFCFSWYLNFAFKGFINPSLSLMEQATLFKLIEFVGMVFPIVIFYIIINIIRCW